MSRVYDSYTKDIVFKVNYEKFSNSNKIKPLDIFMNLEDFSIEHIGKTLYYYGNDEVAIAGHGAILSLKEEFKDLVDLRYISLYMNYNSTFRKDVELLVTGTNTLRIKVDDILGLKLLLPTIEMQKMIVEKYEKGKREIDTLNNKINLFDKIYEFYRGELFSFERDDNGV
ncbi:restriction endonuclease subunit S domain-containing protein [Streptobacillus canis]|uniref:hypothetical protein n=1 Tax=Streptobacillus canis TaxID=2678686 RepID=UPI0012E1C01D|nr:hypothetical protein [Streptobacillus canis]